MSKGLRFLFTLCSLCISLGALSQTLIVGAYSNPPLIDVDSTDQVSGFAIDLLKAIAEEHGWTLEYKAFTFSECLNALERGEIDVMPALAYSATRDSLFLLNQTNVITNWAKIYKHEDDRSSYSSIEMLRGKKIAVLKEDFYAQNYDDGLLDILNELDIESNIKYQNSYKEVIQSLSDKEVDLGLVSRYYGTFNTDNQRVVKTPINIAYVSIIYGFHRTDKNTAIVKRLDQTLQNLIRDRSSVYYALERQHISFKGQEFIPQWLWQTLGIVLVGLTTLAVFTILLQYQVKRKTSQLKESNYQLSISEHNARLASQTIEASQDIGFWFEPGQAFINVNKAASRITGFSEAELMQMVPRDLVSGDKNFEVYEAMRRGEWDGHIVLEDEFKRKDGSIFPVEISLDEFILDGKTFICGFARDISARVKAEYELLEKNKELSCLYAINQLTANKENTVDDVFKRAIKIIPIAWQYPDLTVVKIELNEAVFTSDSFKETPWQLEADLIIGDKKAGRLIVGYLKQVGPVKDPFLVDENNLIMAIAKEISDMLTARYSERRIMASILSTEDKERSRISKELHDSVGQTLSAISLHLKTLLSSSEITEEEKKKLKEIEALVQGAIGESRSISHNLMPPALTDLGFEYAIENILESLAEASPTKFTFNTNGKDLIVPKEIEFALFRVVQEAINNVIKYAEANEVLIQYLVYPDEISLSIEDNGKGFDLKKAEKIHNFGLSSMRNRVLSIGGEIELDTAIDRGTNILIRVPLNLEKDENTTG